MNDSPIDYPIVAPSALSPDAQHIYSHGTYRVESDLFTKRRYVSRDETEAFRPTDRMLAAFAELESAGLGSYNAQYKTLHLQRVAEQYSIAQGRGSQFIKVSILNDDSDEAELLAVLIGADLETASPHGRYRVPEITIRARHESATDVEHDASSTAILTVRSTSQPEFGLYGRMTLAGILTSAKLYPMGVDPLVVDDGDTTPGDICTECDEPHPFAAYQPPLVKSLVTPCLVLVEALPFKPYLIATPPPSSRLPNITESEHA